METVIVKIKPVTFRDSEGIFTISDGNNKGGAIISSVDFFEAMEKFKEASNLACAVKTLIGMRDHEKKFYVAEFIE